jgi:prepilin-type N-terminal cleavage/methylation domain-containing protein
MIAARLPRRGFTLAELLVVIGIIILLVSIGLPTYFAIRRNGELARTRMDLRTLEMGLEEYNRVFNAYPRRLTSNPQATYERVLFKHLISNYRWAEDTEDITRFGITAPLLPGKDQLFGTQDDVPGGRTFGPFVSPEKFKVFKLNRATPPPNNVQVNRGLVDRFGSEILYYPRWLPNVDLKQNGALLGDVRPTASVKAMFCEYDGPTAAEAPGMRQHFYWMLGAKSISDSNPDVDPANSTPNKLISSGDLTFNGPFILISAGPDRRWGLQDNNTKRRKCDDVYNFERP